MQDYFSLIQFITFFIILAIGFSIAKLVEKAPIKCPYCGKDINRKV